MKILTAIFRFFPHGGLQSDFLRIVTELFARGHQVICCTGSWTGTVPPGLNVRTIPLSSWTNHGKALEFEQKIHSVLNAEKPDRFVVFNRMGGADFYFAADNCLLPVWRKKHSPFVLRWLPRYKTFLAQEKAVFCPESKTKILYIVEKQKEEYQAEYGTVPERFLYLPPGINPACKHSDASFAIREEERRKLGLLPENRLLLLVAAQFQVKGADRAIRALAALPDTIRSNCRLLLCGDTKNAKFRQLAESCGVADLILWKGPTPEVPRLLQAADLMVHPARLEAAGAVLTEAVAAGLPAICSGLCGFSCFVAQSGGIVLPEPFDQKDLSDALAKVLGDLRILPEMKKNCLKYSETADFYHRAEVAADWIEQG